LAGLKSSGRCGLNFFVTKIFFVAQYQKFTILTQKKHTPPPPKKGPFGREGGGLIYLPYNYISKFSSFSWRLFKSMFNLRFKKKKIFPK
jgi:hypothetical protein